MSKIDPMAKWAQNSKRPNKGNPYGRGKAKPVSLAHPTSWDRGAEGPANQERLRSEPATDFDPDTGRETPNPNGVKRRRRDDWVSRYHRQGKLTDKQKAAAEKLLMSSEGMREKDPLSALVSVRSLGQSDPEAARVDRRAWFRELWSKVPNVSKPVIERVVLNDLPIWSGGGIQAKDRHMLRLRAGLDAIT